MGEPANSGDSEQNQLLEIYKLHSELADRVSQRRTDANRLYVSLHVAIALLLAALARFGTGHIPAEVILGLVGVVGVSLSLSWLSVINSYRQLNREKFRVLHLLEERLPFQFFKDEWDPNSEGKKSNTYWRLTHTESLLPYLFFLMYSALIAYAVWDIWCGTFNG